MRRRHPQALLVAALLVAIVTLSGCAGVSLVKGGERTDVGSGLSLVPPRDWNRFTSPNWEFWTLDGPHLQQVLFVRGARDGQPIYRVPGAETATSEGEKFPTYRRGMNEIEVIELLQATMAREDLERLTLTEQRPETFAGHRGFHVAFEFVTKHGLEMRGQAVGAVVSDRLYMAVYRGAKLHYFDRGIGDFTRMLETARIDASS